VSSSIHCISLFTREYRSIHAIFPALVKMLSNHLLKKNARFTIFNSKHTTPIDNRPKSKETVQLVGAAFGQVSPGRGTSSAIRWALRVLSRTRLRIVADFTSSSPSRSPKISGWESHEFGGPSGPQKRAEWSQDERRRRRVGGKTAPSSIFSTTRPVNNNNNKNKTPFWGMLNLFWV